MPATTAEKSPYVVTDKGGPRPDIAGRLRVVGSTLMLTAIEAEYELKRGTLITLEQHEAEQSAVDAAAEPAAGEVEDAA